MTTRRTIAARFAAFGTATGIGGALAACGAERSEAPAQTKAAGKLEFYDWWLPASSPLQDNWWKFVKEDFERKHTGVTVEFNFISGTSGVRDKLKTAAAADTSPDASHASVGFVRSMWDAGLLAELNAYVAKTPDVAMNKFLDQALFFNQKAGRIYGLPMEGPDADAFFYNKAHFQEVGLDPSPDKTHKWTYDDLVAAATKLTKGSGGDVQRRGLSPHGISTGNVAAWLYTNGATWYGKDNLSVAFNTPQGVQVLEYLLDLRKRFPEPPSYAGLTGDQQFYQQKTSIVPQGNFNVHVVRGFAPEVQFDMMPLPKGPAGKGPATKVWMNQVIMPKNAKNKDLGWLFMAYYSGKETIAKRMTLLNRMGPRKDFFESPEWKEETKKIPALNQAPKVAATAGYYPYIMYQEVDEVIAPIFAKLQRSEIGARDALGEIEREANRILTQQPR